MANDIENEPAFKWWVKDVIQKRNNMIMKVRTRYWRTTHKYGVELPHSYEEALEIDRRTGTSFWRDAIAKEMATVRVAFENFTDGTIDECRRGQKLIGHKEVTGHLIFDIKLDGKFARKARHVADGHKTAPPTSLTYASVVSRESVRIALLYAGLNDLSVYSADIEGAYLQAPCREKLYLLATSEFKEEEGCVFVVKRALYGLKSAGASWRAHLQQVIVYDLKWEQTFADSCVCRRKKKHANGEFYWEWLLVCVDDLLCVSEHPDKAIEEMPFKKKAGSTGEPERYLGANVHCDKQLPNGRLCYAMSANDYVKEAVKQVERNVDEHNKKNGANVRLPSGRSSDRPYAKSYRPELDSTDCLDDALASLYMSYIGILRWSVELGRFDIATEVSHLSSYLVSPRQGHLDAVYNIFGYLKRHGRSSLYFDYSEPNFDPNKFIKQSWEDFYGDIREEIPPNMPEPLGKAMSLSAFVDADHAGNLVTRRSQTGFFIFIQNSVMDWCSKKQNTVEGSTFGSEHVAARICVEKKLKRCVINCVCLVYRLMDIVRFIVIIMEWYVIILIQRQF